MRTQTLGLSALTVPPFHLHSWGPLPLSVKWSYDHSHLLTGLWSRLPPVPALSLRTADTNLQTSPGSAHFKTFFPARTAEPPCLYWIPSPLSPRILTVTTNEKKDSNLPSLYNSHRECVCVYLCVPVCVYVQVKEDGTWVLNDLLTFERPLQESRSSLRLPASLGFPGLLLQVLCCSSRTWI